MLLRALLASVCVLLVGSLEVQGRLSRVDTSTVNIDSFYYTILGCARDLLIPSELSHLYQLRIYPNDQLTWCVFRCLGQRLGIYDDSNGLDLDKQYNRVKNKVSIDEVTYKRTIQNCIQRQTANRLLGDCERAYLILTRCLAPTAMLLTVDYCSGGIDTSRVTLDSTFYTILGCAADLFASPDLIALYHLRIYPDEPTTWCVFRCLGQRLKTYDDTNGFNVDLQYERLKDSLTISEQKYKQGLRNCIQRVTEGRRLGICEKAYRILRGCQGDTIERAHQKQLNDCLGSIDISTVNLSATYYNILRCANDLYASKELIALYHLRIYPDEPTTWCVFRCLGQRLKIYDDTDGFNVDLQYERLKDSLMMSEQKYKQGLRNCIRRVTEGRRLGICEKPFRILRGCQGDTVDSTHLRQLNEIRVCD
uniref:Uncharacterized protein n=1 Tax=Anopheles albimanus TaxID=7167 RepID=A0A182F8B3_ANOAL